MASIFPEIRRLLETHLANVVGIPDIAWENVEFEPTTGTSFIKPTILPTIRRPSCAGPNPEQYHQGLFILECYVPNEGGPSASDDLTKLVIDSFETTTIITDGTYSLQIRRAEHSQGVTEGPWRKTIANISWFTYN